MIPGQTRQSVALEATARRPHYVYRCYDADDRLIYIGCTVNPTGRLQKHQHAKSGAQLASRVLSVCMTRFEVGDEYPDRESGQRAEAEAIRKNTPLLNFEQTRRPSWMTLQKIAIYLLSQGIDIESVGMSRCVYCDFLRPYRATGWLCTDCHDPEFRAYIDRKQAAERVPA